MTRKVLVYDCFSGISGDMHIGAMLDLGVPRQLLIDALARLGMNDEYELLIAEDAKLGITGTKVTVKLKKKSEHARHLSDIRKIIEAADYSPDVTERALDIFMKIAVAEAKIHGTSIEAVHFHEVGATDSIVDVVAAAICLSHLNVDQVVCPTLELGGGMVRCAHGLMPVPAPATAEILVGIPCRYNGVDEEATTPTGAAIIKHAVHGFELPNQLNVTRIGYGIGQKDFKIPNVLRVMLATADESETTHPSATWFDTERNLQIDCNIDDMPAEAFQPLIDRLFEAGAKDVFLTPIVMKKSRPATQLSVLVDPESADALLRILFANSTTIGVRTHVVEKHMLPRQLQKVATVFGEVGIKLVTLPDATTRWKLEHDDVVHLAQANNQDYLSMQKQLNREVARALEQAESESEDS